MPKSQPMAFADLQKLLASDPSLTEERSEDDALAFAMRGRAEVAYAIVNTDRPGVGRR